MLHTLRHHAALGISLAASALLHVIAAALLSQAVVGGYPVPEVADARARAENDPIRLGIDRSEAVSVNWLGFETPTEHAGPESEVEQSAMELAHAQETEPESGDEGEADPSPTPPPSIADRRVAEAALRALESARASALALAEAIAAAIEGPFELAKADEPAPPDSRQPAPSSEALAPPARAATPARGSLAEPADGRAPIITDKESIATALRNAPSVVPGRVLAAQGLEIQTRRPRWSRLTLLTRRPANPIVQITFGRDGRVRRAGFLSDGEVIFGTGFDDVDEPLLSAIFLWTARGQPLERLPADDPEAGLTIEVRVILLS